MASISPLVNRLFVGDDCQSFEGSGRQTFEEFFPIELGNRFVKILLGEELPATAGLPNFKRVKLGCIFFHDAFDGAF